MPNQFIQALIEEDILAFGGTIYAPAVDDNVISPSNLSGFHLEYSSASVVTVGYIGANSTCADSSNGIQITLSGQSTVTVTTNAAINGNDSFTGPGTVTVANAATAVTGTSTTFTTSFGIRVGSGTLTTVGTAATGTGTSFMTGPTKLSVGDLIGTAAKGYSQVTAIASDTACTLQAAIPGGDLTAVAFNIVENPTIKIGTNTVSQVAKITSDTSLTLASNSSAAQTGVTYTIGNVPNLGTQPATNQAFMYIWVGVGSSGTGCYASTQRTTPFGIANYNANFRRVGSIMLNAGSVTAFSQAGEDRAKWYQYEVAQNTLSLRALSAGTATTWTAVILSAGVPPTSIAATLNMSVTTSIGNIAYFRRRGTGSSTGTRGIDVACTASGGSTSLVPNFIHDGAGGIDYQNNSGLLQTYIDICGYLELS